LAASIPGLARISAEFCVIGHPFAPARPLPFMAACVAHKGGSMPSPLFNFLFLAALIIPATMYIIGVVILMISLVVKHFHATAVRTHTTEAVAH
jgi:hypothetical protein